MKFSLKNLVPSAENLSSRNVAVIVVVSAIVHLLVGMALLYLSYDTLLTIAMMIVNVALLVVFWPVLLN